jgi:hypothetical protein
MNFHKGNHKRGVAIFIELFRISAAKLSLCVVVKMPVLLAHEKDTPFNTCGGTMYDSTKL